MVVSCQIAQRNAKNGLSTILLRKTSPVVAAFFKPFRFLPSQTLAPTNAQTTIRTKVITRAGFVPRKAGISAELATRQSLLSAHALIATAAAASKLRSTIG